jgi:23S rRNA (adenine2030-N6)-methyltransferase
MNYDHAYHAANLADVLKHIVLIFLIERMQEKEKGFFYLDTHAGSGLYDLQSIFSQKTGEAQSGIHALWPQLLQSENSTLQNYMRLLKPYIHNKVLRNYPGSVLLAERLLRHQDRMAAAELHPDAFAALKRQISQNNSVKIYNESGYGLLKKLLPPLERRGLILIDPPYESRTEWKDLLIALKEIHKRFATAQIVIWYPLKAKLNIRSWIEELKELGFASILNLSWASQNKAPSSSLSGAGLVLINPPWKFEEQTKPLLTSLLSPQDYKLNYQWLINNS